MNRIKKSLQNYVGRTTLNHTLSKKKFLKKKKRKKKKTSRTHQLLHSLVREIICVANVAQKFKKTSRDNVLCIGLQKIDIKIADIAINSPKKAPKNPYSLLASAPRTLHVLLWTTALGTPIKHTHTHTHTHIYIYIWSYCIDIKLLGFCIILQPQTIKTEPPLYITLLKRLFCNFFIQEWPLN